MAKFLIIRLGSLGDVVHGIPVAAALRRRYPQSHIDWLVDPRYMELLDLVECVDSAIPFDPHDLRRGRAGAWRSLRRVRRGGYDAAIDLQGLVKSAVVARLVGARSTIGFSREHLREPLAGAFYTETPHIGAAAHVIHKNLALLGPLDVADRAVQFPIAVPQTPAVAEVVGRLGDRRYVLLNPGAAWPNKRWPPARFGSVAAAIHRNLGLRSVVLWGPGEQPLADAVVTASDSAAEIAPPTTIRDLFGIAHAARLVISGDTGPLHIAAAIGTPVVALFGPTYPARNGPWSPQDVVVSRVASCSCIYQRRCRRPTPCIDDITVDEVLDAVHRRLALT